MDSSNPILLIPSCFPNASLFFTSNNTHNNNNSELLQHCLAQYYGSSVEDNGDNNNKNNSQNQFEYSVIAGQNLVLLAILPQTNRNSVSNNNSITKSTNNNMDTRSIEISLLPNNQFIPISFDFPNQHSRTNNNFINSGSTAVSPLPLRYKYQISMNSNSHSGELLAIFTRIPQFFIENNVNSTEISMISITVTIPSSFIESKPYNPLYSHRNLELSVSTLREFVLSNRVLTLSEPDLTIVNTFNYIQPLYITTQVKSLQNGSNPSNNSLIFLIISIENCTENRITLNSIELNLVCSQLLNNNSSKKHPKNKNESKYRELLNELLNNFQWSIQPLPLDNGNVKSVLPMELEGGEQTNIVVQIQCNSNDHSTLFQSINKDKNNNNNNNNSLEIQTPFTIRYNYHSTGMSNKSENKIELSNECRFQWNYTLQNESSDLVAEIHFPILDSTTNIPLSNNTNFVFSLELTVKNNTKNQSFPQLFAVFIPKTHPIGKEFQSKHTGKRGKIRLKQVHTRNSIVKHSGGNNKNNNQGSLNNKNNNNNTEDDDDYASDLEISVDEGISDENTDDDVDVNSKDRKFTIEVEEDDNIFNSSSLFLPTPHHHHNRSNSNNNANIPNRPIQSAQPSLNLPLFSPFSPNSHHFHFPFSNSEFALKSLNSNRANKPSSHLYVTETTENNSSVTANNNSNSNTTMDFNVFEPDSRCVTLLQNNSKQTNTNNSTDSSKNKNNPQNDRYLELGLFRQKLNDLPSQGTSRNFIDFPLVNAKYKNNLQAFLADYYLILEDTSTTSSSGLATKSSSTIRQFYFASNLSKDKS